MGSSFALTQEDVHRASAHLELRAVIAERGEVDVCEEVLSVPEDDRSAGQVQFVTPSG
jgi:hypothetical protein